MHACGAGRRGEPARNLNRSTLPYSTSHMIGAAVADDGRVALGSGIGLVPGMRPDDATGELWIVDARTGARKTIFVPGGAGSIAFSPGGRFVATAGPETARIWDTLPARFGRALPVLRGHAGGISDVAFAPDGETVLTASDDGSARLWRAATGEQLAVLRSPAAPKRALFSPSGKRIVTTRRGEVRVWAVDSVPAQFARRLPPMFESPPIGAITFARDGSHLVAAGSRRMDPGNQARAESSARSIRQSYPGSIFSVSPDGRLIAYGRGVQEVDDRSLALAGAAVDATFSRDSARLAFVDAKGRVGVWTTRSGQVRILGRDPEAYDAGSHATVPWS